MTWLSRSLSILLLCLAAAAGAQGAFAQEEDPGLPLPTLRPPRIAVPNIEGKWITRNGSEIQITQRGEEIELRSAVGRLYVGKLRGRRLELAHTYRSIADVPPRVPEALRSAMVGTRLPFEGDVAPDGKSITAEVTEVEMEPDARGVAIANRKETRTPVTLTRFKPKPEVIAIFVPANQMARRDELALYKHPSNDSFGRSMRNLLVVGRNLPAEWSDAKVESSDPAIDYMVLRLAHDPTDRYQDDLASALSYVARNLDEDSAEAVMGLDQMLVRASFGRNVLPGTKTLTLNGVSRTWKLEFGDTKGELQFVRSTGPAFENTKEIFLPETVALELHATAKLDVRSINVIVEQKGASAVAPFTLPANRISEKRTEEGYVVVYRTQPIQVAEAGGTPATIPNATRVIARPDDKLAAKLEKDEWLQAERVEGSLFTEGAPAPETVGVVANIRRTPAKLGKLWKEALTTAAKCAGKPVEDFGTLSGREATEITNYILFTTDDLARRILTQQPFYERKLTVQIRDHAAMLLLRDELMQMMQEQARALPDVRDDATLRGFRRLIAPYAGNPAFPLNHLRVTPPAGGVAGCGPASLDVAFGQLLQRLSPLVATRADFFPDSCPFEFAFNDFFLERAFPRDREAAERWSLGAVKEGFDVYRKSVDKTVEKASGLGACDVEGLLKLSGSGYEPVGQGFEPVVDRLLPKLMRLEESNGALAWVPDAPARGAVASLRTLAAAVRAQRDYSDLDTQYIVMAAGTVALIPALVSGAPLAVLLAAVGNVAIAGADAAIQIHDYVEREREVERAMGASLVLGTGRLTAAELQRTSVWQLALALANVGLASGELLSAISQVSKASAIARGAELVSQVESGGTGALRRMPPADHRDVLAFIADAELSRVANGEKALSDAQRSGLKAGRALDADPRVAAELARLDELDPGNAVVREINSLVGRDPEAVGRAHRVGAGELGADGVRPAGIGNYTASQIREKVEILRAAGYSSDETRLLMEEGVVGKAVGPPFSTEGLSKTQKTQGWLRAADGHAERVYSPRTRPGGGQTGLAWSTEARENFTRRSLQDAAATAAQHAEGQAAMRMWERVKKGEKAPKLWLDINNDYICHNCFNTIGSLLPPDSELTVRFLLGKDPGQLGPMLLKENGFALAKDVNGVQYAYKTFYGF